MPHMVWITLPDGYHEWYNRRWYEFTGVPENSTDGAGWNEIFHPDDRERAWAQWRRSLATGEPYEIEYRLRHHTGEYRWVLGRALPIRDSQGRIERWFGTCTDIDAMKRAEEALQETARQKDEFLAMLAHELRNPLAPILNATAVLEVRGGNDAVIRRQREVIHRQAQHMTRLVADLLDVSRLHRGTYTLEREPLDLVRTVRNCVEDYRGTLENQGLEVVMKLPDTPLLVNGDRVRLSQALGNLLSNAAKFTPSGGMVMINLRESQSNGVPQAVISVRDTGAGISSEALSSIWEIFVQGKQDLARSKGGLGLGLALVKGIVELHGGSASAASEGERRGAEFTLTLPVLTGSPSPAVGAKSPGAASDQGGRTILLIEDNRDAAETMQELLELHGYEVYVAFNGPEGLDAARRLRPSVVLCDLGLPDLSGHEIAEALRGDPATRDLRLIAVSGYAQPADTARSRAAGFDHHLAKPVELDGLLQLILEAGRQE
jgi:PAS domain S-box-containing protein